MKILWLTNIPSPYRVDFFNELGKKCDLTVLFERHSSSERDKNWKPNTFVNFKTRFLQGKKVGVDKAFCPSVVAYVNKKQYDHIIVSNVASPTGILAILTMKLRKIPYAVEGDGGFAGSGRGFKERLKKILISGASLGFSTNKLHDEYYKRYGLSEDRIVRYPFTSLFEDDILRRSPTDFERLQLRKKLNIYEGKVVLSVGQFIRRKGFDLLLEAKRYISKDVGLYFVGGSPSEEYLNVVRKFDLKNVHFIGFKGKRELDLYYQAADVFVLPTREDIWGLVVNEAMSNACPIITTERCGAGLELIDGNGYVVPCESSDELAKKIKLLLNDEEKLVEARRRSLEIIADFSYEKMVEAHLDALK